MFVIRTLTTVLASFVVWFKEVGGYIKCRVHALDSKWNYGIVFTAIVLYWDDASLVTGFFSIKSKRPRQHALPTSSNTSIV